MKKKVRNTSPQKQEDDDDVDLSSTKPTDNNDTPASTKPSLYKLFKLATPEMPMLIVSFILMIGAEATNMITPLIVANEYDILVDPTIVDEGEKMSQINYYMLLAVIITIAGIVAGFIRATIQGVIGERVVARLRCRLYKQILGQEIAFFDEHKSGELVSRLGSDTTLLQSVVSQSLPDFLTQFIKAISAMVLMFYISVKLAGLALGGVVLIFMMSSPMGFVLGRLSKKYQDVLGQAQTVSTEAISSMRTVQAFAAEKKEQHRYNSKIGNPDDIPWWYPPAKQVTTYRVGFFKSVAQSGFFTFVFGLGFGFLNVTLWYGFYLVLQDELTLGDLTAFNSYIISIGFAMGQVANSVAKVFEGLGASGRVFYLLERIPKIPDPDTKEKETIKPERMFGTIELKGVTFSYPTRPDQPILDDISLSIPSGSVTALVGSSGAGKSTIVSLLQRFYDINQGTITIYRPRVKAIWIIIVRKYFWRCILNRLFR